MKNLSEKNSNILLEGARTLGNFTDGYDYIEGRLLISQAEELYNFCQWLDREVGGAGRGNIQRLFDCYKKRNRR